jgi:hypothetical protein
LEADDVDESDSDDYTPRDRLKFDDMTRFPTHLITSREIERFKIPWVMHNNITGNFTFIPGPTIINLDTSKEGRGTHWVSLYRVPNRFSYYFDPIGEQFGGYPPIAVRHAITSEVLYYNRQTYQPPKSFLCGYFAIYFCLAMRQHAPQSPSECDKILEDIFGLNANLETIIKVLNL